MKTIFIFAIALLFSVHLKAQAYLPTVEEDKVWELRYNLINTYKEYFLTCDTMISGHDYIMVKWADGSLMGYVREDTTARKVYYLRRDSVPERIIMDYTLVAGDTFSWSADFSADVDSVETEFLFGQMRKVIYFTPGLWWIEGIGKNMDGIITDESGFGTNVSNVRFAEDNCSAIIVTGLEDNIDASPSVSFNPNPFQSNLSVTGLISANAYCTIYGLSGEKIMEFYISNGKQIDMHALHPGIYFAVISDNGGLAATKIIKN